MSSHVIRTAELSLGGAERLIALGLEAAQAQGLRLCLAVTDAHGQLRAFARMDGAGLVSIEVAIGKARTAAYLKMPAAVFEEKIAAGEAAILACRELTPLRGGVPVRLAGETVGAFGVSGAAGETDEAVAAAVVARFAKETKEIDA